MQLNKTQKGLITIAVIGLAAFVAYKVATKKPKSGTAGGGSDTGGSGTGATTSDLNFSMMADQLFASMDGYGTKNKVIFEIFSKLKSDADFNALYNAYGVRTLSSGWGNPRPDFSGNLVECLRDELSNTEIANVNRILAGNGLTKTI